MMLSWLLIGKKNMVNRILIDTNVLLDYLLTRKPFYEEAKTAYAIVYIRTLNEFLEGEKK